MTGPLSLSPRPAAVLVRAVLIAALLSPLAGSTFAQGPRTADLSNLEVQQQGNQVLITYDLQADGPTPVSIKGSADGGKGFDLELWHLTGDVGEEVSPGKGKAITWDLMQDYPRGLQASQFVVELSTSGGAFVDPTAAMELVCVKGGTFEMGDTFGDGEANEKPVHTVTVSDFCIGKTEVTQAQWEKVMGSNPSYFKGDDRPVEQVSWDGAQEFLRELNERSGKRYRLPTEAEWEYAARSGGKREKWAGTSNGEELGDCVWHDGNSQDQTHPVGQKKPNGLGLYDMSGNVWEWVQDGYASSFFPAQGDSPGSYRVARGGSWNKEAGSARAANRSGLISSYRLDDLGFRLTLSSP